MRNAKNVKTTNEKIILTAKASSHDTTTMNESSPPTVYQGLSATIIPRPTAVRGPDRLHVCDLALASRYFIQQAGQGADGPSGIAKRKSFDYRYPFNGHPLVSKPTGMRIDSFWWACGGAS
ncbi:MAG TPA: hypothetical protein DDZ51_10645 [Planctomycetaceae bacterium]|nr:hypothetical protein [Planctomycetaceae bacterium]